VGRPILWGGNFRKLFWNIGLRDDLVGVWGGFSVHGMGVDIAVSVWSYVWSAAMKLTKDVSSLGERMVELARIAVAMHLDLAGATNGTAEHMLRQRVGIGGADFSGMDSPIAGRIDHADQVTDDGLPPAGGRLE
jgi:hypothetical protein